MGLTSAEGQAKPGMILTPGKVRLNDDAVLLYGIEKGLGIPFKVPDSVRIVDSLFNRERRLVLDWESVFRHAVCGYEVQLSVLRSFEGTGNSQDWFLVGLQQHEGVCG